MLDQSGWIETTKNMLAILHRRADWISVAVMTGAIAVPSAALAGVSHPLLWVAGLVLTYMSFVVNHNHQHLPIARSAFANKSVGILLTLAIGLPAAVIRPLHVLNHHAAVDGPGDFMSTRRLRGGPGWWNLLRYPVVAAIGYAGPRRAAIRGMAIADPAWGSELRGQRIALWGAIGILAVWQPVTAAWAVVLPWLLAQYWVVNANYLQHAGCDPTDQRRHSRTILSRPVNWLTLNGGYHAAHHDHPTAHWRDLPALHAAMYADLPREWNRPSLLGLILDLARRRQA